MPLQWLPLQQRQKQQPRSAVSQALTPRGGGGIREVSGLGGIGFVERQKAKWAEEDKLRKLERDKKVQEAQEMGMRIRALYEKEKLGGRQVPTQAAAGAPGAAPTAAPLTKENMPEAAMATWKFISTLEPESQKFFIQQLKEKELGTGGYIETGGVRKEMPGSLGMYGHLVDQGLIDPATDTVIEKEREFEKGTFTIIEEGGTVYQLNTATGERKQIGTVDEPEGVVDAINKQANADALALSKAAEGISFEDAKHDALIDYGIDEEVAADMAKVKEIPKDKKTSWYKNFINWIKGGAPKVTEKGWAQKGAGAKPTFNEANVTSLVPVISDDVTTAERAHYKSEGASDADIDEAIRRKVIK